MKLSTLAIGLGALFSVPQIYGLLKPSEFAAAARKFPRSVWWGYLLMGLGTAWFLWNVNAEAISDFASYKTPMLLGFGAVGVMSCIYVKDFLAVRGLAIIMLLLAKLILDTARWHPSSWRLVLSVLAYIWVIAGMWFTISPWRLRDLIQWHTATPRRIKLGSAVRLGVALFIVFLGLTKF